MTRKLAARLFGLALSAICLAYFAFAVRDILSETTVSLWDSPALRALPWASIPYLVAYGVLALAWHCLLKAIGLTPSAACSMGIYFTTQIGKYLPGNVGQHIGRVYLSSTHGMPSVRVGLSIVIEAALMVGSAAVLSLPLAPMVVHFLSANGSPWKILLAALAGAAVCGVVAIRLFAHRPLFVKAKAHLLAAMKEVMHASNRLFLVGAAALTLAGLALASLSLVVLSGASAPSASIMTLVEWIALFSAAWIAGFLTPGAPAGLGVREAILLAGLSPSIGDAAAVEATVFFRCLSVGADLTAALFGTALLMAQRGAKRE